MHIISALPDSVDEAWATRHFGALDVPHGKKLQSNVAIGSLWINHSFMLTLCKTERVLGLLSRRAAFNLWVTSWSESQFSSPWTLEQLIKTNYFEESDRLDRISGREGDLPSNSVVGTVKSANISPYIRWEPFLQTTSSLRCRSIIVIRVFFLASMAAYFRP